MVTESNGWTERLLVGAYVGAVWGIALGFLPASLGGPGILVTFAFVAAAIGAITAAAVHLQRGRQPRRPGRSRVVAAVVVMATASVIGALLEHRDPRWTDWIPLATVLAFTWTVHRLSSR